MSKRNSRGYVQRLASGTAGLPERPRQATGVIVKASSLVRRDPTRQPTGVRIEQLRAKETELVGKIHKRARQGKEIRVLVDLLGFTRSRIFDLAIQYGKEQGID